MFTKIKLYFQRIEQMDSLMTQRYSQGQQDASNRFLEVQKEMNETVEKLTKDNIDTEKRLRAQTEKRIADIEKLHYDTCTICKQNVEEERQRLLKLQSYLSNKINKFNDVWLKMFSYAELIIEEQDTLLKAAGRIKAYKDTLIKFRKEVDNLEDDAVPLLSLEHLTKEDNKK